MQHIYNTVSALKRGEVVLVPTDTNYALAADPWNIQACKKIYDLKKRDANKPLTLFISNPSDAWKYISTEKIKHLHDLNILISNMPNPLNIVVPSSDNVPINPYIKADSVSIVCNKQNVLNKVIELFGRPLGMSSANLSGIESEGLIDINSAREIFGDKVGYILPAEDFNSTTTSSTIVSLLENDIKILRKGDLDISEILSL